MANIDVQKKRKLSFPWILIILILIIAAVLFYMNRDKISSGNLTASPTTADTMRDPASGTRP
jgi:CHASE3 domain sensor protein